MKRFFAVLFAALMFTPAAYASRNAVLDNVRDKVILQTPSEQAGKKTREAILQSAQQHGWKTVQDTPPVLQLRLDVRNKHSIVVNVTVKGNKVDVDYVDSINMYYRKYEDGQESIHSSYNRWVANLLETARNNAAMQ